MKIIAKLLILLAITATILLLVYYGHIRNRYVDVLHTKLNINEFEASHEGIEEIIDWYFTTYKVPSISVSIIENGIITKYISKGYQNKKNDKPVNENSIYQIASLSKTMTGIICNSLIINGELDIDAHIIDIIGPNLSIEATEKVKEITIRNLLMHTSGIKRELKAFKKEDIFSSLENEDLDFQPGEKFQYSNYAYALLAYILEIKTGMDYEELLLKYVSNQIDSKDITVNLNQNQQNKLVIPYWVHFKPIKGAIEDFGMQTSASGIFASNKSLSELMINQLNAYQQIDSVDSNSSLNLTNDKYEVAPESNVFYGYGLIEYNFDIDYDTTIVHKYLKHGGDNDGYASNYGFFPDYNMGVVLMTSWGGPWFLECEKDINEKLLEIYLKENETKPNIR